MSWFVKSNLRLKALLGASLPCSSVIHWRLLWFKIQPCLPAASKAAAIGPFSLKVGRDPRSAQRGLAGRGGCSRLSGYPVYSPRGSRVRTGAWPAARGWALRRFSGKESCPVWLRTKLGKKQAHSIAGTPLVWPGFDHELMKEEAGPGWPVALLSLMFSLHHLMDSPECLGLMLRSSWLSGPGPFMTLSLPRPLVTCFPRLEIPPNSEGDCSQGEAENIIASLDSDDLRCRPWLLGFAPVMAAAPTQTNWC